MQLNEFIKYLDDTYNIKYGDMHKFLRMIKFPRMEGVFTYREAYLYCETHRDLVNFYLL